jgi:Helix-turn-helix domain
MPGKARNMNERIVPIEEAAEILDCSVKYAKNQLRSGQWPGRKLAGRWSFSVSDLQAIIDAGSNQR